MSRRKFLHMEGEVHIILSQTEWTIPDIVIRSAVHESYEDARLLGRLYAESYFELMDQLPPPHAETLEDFIEMMTEVFLKAAKEPREDIVRWVAEYAGAVVGFLITKATQTCGYIGEVGVLPSYRRKGVAKALLHTFAGYLKARGIPVMRLDVNVENIPAIKFYESCGFESCYEHEKH